MEEILILSRRFSSFLLSDYIEESRKCGFTGTVK